LLVVATDSSPTRLQLNTYPAPRRQTGTPTARAWGHRWHLFPTALLTSAHPRRI